MEWGGVGWSGVEWSEVEWSGAEWSGVEWSGVQPASQVIEKHCTSMKARPQFLACGAVIDPDRKAVPPTVSRIDVHTTYKRYL